MPSSIQPERIWPDHDDWQLRRDRTPEGWKRKIEDRRARFVAGVNKLLDNFGIEAEKEIWIENEEGRKERKEVEPKLYFPDLISTAAGAWEIDTEIQVRNWAATESRRYKIELRSRERNIREKLRRYHVWGLAKFAKYTEPPARGPVIPPMPSFGEFLECPVKEKTSKAPIANKKSSHLKPPRKTRPS